MSPVSEPRPRRVEQFYPAAPYPQPLSCSWCCRRDTDLETEIDGSFVCMDLAGCQLVFDTRRAGTLAVVSAIDRRRLRHVLTEEELDASLGEVAVLDL